MFRLVYSVFDSASQCFWTVTLISKYFYIVEQVDILDQKFQKHTYNSISLIHLRNHLHRLFLQLSSQKNAYMPCFG